MRLDKFLCELNLGSRSQVKLLIRQGLVSVNDVPAKSPDQKIDEEQDRVTCRGKQLFYEKFHYYLLNKPKGVVTATTDPVSKTVMELLPVEVRKNLFPVGRLDKDTEGLLLLTDDGELAHRLLSPARHVDKTYLVHTAAPLTDADCQALEQGVDIGEGVLTMPAVAEKQAENVLLLTIHEGKFHQVKRMLKAVNNEVILLKRLRFGPLILEEAKLQPGEYRRLTDKEVLALHE